MMGDVAFEGIIGDFGDDGIPPPPDVPTAASSRTCRFKASTTVECSPAVMVLSIVGEPAPEPGPDPVPKPNPLLGKPGGVPSLAFEPLPPPPAPSPTGSTLPKLILIANALNFPHSFALSFTSGIALGTFPLPEAVEGEEVIAAAEPGGAFG